MYSLNDSLLNIAHILPNQYSWQFFCDKPNKTILNFFSCRKVSNILSMQNLQNTSLLIFFTSNLIRDEKYVYYYIFTYYIFSFLMWSNMVLKSDFNFPFLTSTPFSVFFAVDIETTHSKRILFLLVLFNLMNGTIKFFELFLLIFFEDGRPTTVNSTPFGLLLFLDKEIYEYFNIS